jgi:hypothetical protein
MHVDPFSVLGAVLGSTLMVQFGRPMAVRLARRLSRRRR